MHHLAPPIIIDGKPPSSVLNNRHHQSSSLPSIWLMLSAASAFLIGQYDAIAARSLSRSSCSYLFTVCSSSAFGSGLFWTIRSKSAINEIRLEHSFTYICASEPVSLSLSLLMLEGIYVCPESSRHLFGIIDEPAKESAENQPSNPADSSPTARPLKSATRLHSLPWLCDRVKTAFGNLPLRDSQHVLVREGPSAQGY